MPHRPDQQPDMDRMLRGVYDRGAQARAEIVRLEALPAAEREAMRWQIDYWRGVDKVTR